LLLAALVAVVTVTVVAALQTLAVEEGLEVLEVFQKPVVMVAQELSLLGTTHRVK
jgi:hypothetical protein